MTQKFGILAFPAKHSLSPVMHNAAFQALGIDAEYGVFEIPPEDLRGFMMEARETIAGLSVSVPYKETILKHLDEISPEAQKIGAVNTILNRDGRLSGFNTDFIGSNKALEEVCDLKGKKVVVLGAGGSARAIIYGILEAGGKVIVKNRTQEKAEKLAEEFGVEASEWGAVDQADILIHTTSVWLEDPGSVPFFCNLEYLDHFEIVMDIFYKPLTTPLLKEALKLGKTIVTGEKMLVFQAAEQFKLWTDRETPVEVMKKAITDCA